MRLLRNIKNRLIRIRHRKGHGVHSPYVYNIVREVFMNSTIHDEESELYAALIELGCKSKQARELQNLYMHCGYNSFSIDKYCSCDIVICSSNCTMESTLRCIEMAKDEGKSVIVLRNNRDSVRDAIEQSVVKQHCSTSVDKSGYLLIFNNHLPKQHFIL